ncbi:MAG: sterol desaturase family protein [Bernardetiaceae bacterium]|nr:sterol desaturase family protein [Bernardetiaceae bacterium]
MNKYLKEFFFYPHVLIHILLLLVAVVGIFIFDYNAFLWLALPLGFITFMVAEYFAHRFLFHQKLPKKGIGRLLLKKLHYDHHKDPKSMAHLFIPLWFIVPAFALNTLLVWALFNDATIAMAFATGSLLSLLHYEWTHYSFHRPIKHKGLYEKMRLNHMRHHYKNGNKGFGVTNPIFDKLLGTSNEEK